MPDVRDGESRDSYMDRCMGDSETVEKYENPSQRAAVCNSMYDDKKGQNAEAGMEDYIFSTEEGAKKKSMEIGFNGEIHIERMADGTPMYFPAKTDEEFQRWFNKNDSHDDETVEAAEYQGKKVTLGKPFRTQGGKKKFAVYVKNSSGRVVVVRFGDPNMEIKRDDPKRRKAFRDRHNCDTATDRTTPRYWSCRQWRGGSKVEASENEHLLYDEWMQNEGEVIEGIEEVVEAACCSSCAEHGEAKEIRPDVYDNPAEATNRAKEIGCDGIHSHQEKGETIFMPCKSHEDYSRMTKEKEAGYHDDDEKKKGMASECPIGEEMVAGSCQPINVTMEATVESIVATVEASTGNTIMEIKGIAFHEGFNKNKWAITKRGAEATVKQMFGADLTLNHPKAKAVGFERNQDGGVNEANVGIVVEASMDDKGEAGYEVRYAAHVQRSELFEALESGMWLKPDYGVSIGGYGVPISANEKGMVFDMDFTFDHLAIVHKPAYSRANIESANKIEETVEAKHGGQHGKPAKNDPRKTPAKPSERRKGSKKNPPGSAKKPNKSIVVSPATRTTIRNKMQEHNKKGKGSKASMGALLTVFRRGAGAFSTSHAPNMSRNGWGIARVNAFIYLLRTGRPSNPNYKQDNDLLPKGHPRAKRTSKAEETLISQTASQQNYRKEITNMSDEEIIEDTISASELESLQAELVLARAELEEMKAHEAAQAEEERLGLVASATSLGLKGHEDLSSETLSNLIASWEASHPAEPVVEMKPAEPAVASEESPSPVNSEKVVANYLNGKMVETPESLYTQAWNAWASAWNKTLSGVENNDERIRAPKYSEI